MYEDDFYVSPDAMSNMVEKLINDSLDFVPTDSWRLDTNALGNNCKS